MFSIFAAEPREAGSPQHHGRHPSHRRIGVHEGDAVDADVPEGPQPVERSGRGGEAHLPHVDDKTDRVPGGGGLVPWLLSRRRRVIARAMKLQDIR